MYELKKHQEIVKELNKTKQKIKYYNKIFDDISLIFFTSLAVVVLSILIIHQYVEIMMSEMPMSDIPSYYYGFLLFYILMLRMLIWKPLKEIINFNIYKSFKFIKKYNYKELIKKRGYWEKVENEYIKQLNDDIFKKIYKSDSLKEEDIEFLKPYFEKYIKEQKEIRKKKDAKKEALTQLKAIEDTDKNNRIDKIKII